MRIIAIGLITLLLIPGVKTGCSLETMDDKIIYVDDDNIEGPWDGTSEHPYKCIRQGIENAGNGDTIRVYSGIYNGGDPIYINKTLNIIGNGSASTKIIGCRVSISADGVILRGMEVFCIDLKNAHNCSIDNTTISSNLLCISLYNSSNNVIENNNISSESSKPTMYIFSSYNNVIRKNIIISTRYGIYLDHSKNNLLDGNNICEHPEYTTMDYCVFLLLCDNNTVVRNNLAGSGSVGFAIGMTESNYNKIECNIIKNTWGAMDLDSSNNNIIRGNNISKIEYGISLHHSSYNTIDENTIINSEKSVGVGLFHDSNNNVVSRNILNNIWCSVAMGDAYENTIKLNSMVNNSWCGISLDETGKNTIYKNIIKNNGNKSKPDKTGGIIFWGKSYGDTISWNNIEGNENFGIKASKSRINARFNWWGSPLGPSRTKFMFRGDRIISEKSRIKRFPWLLAPYGFSPDEN